MAHKDWRILKSLEFQELTTSELGAYENLRDYLKYWSAMLGQKLNSFKDLLEGWRRHSFPEQQILQFLTSDLYETDSNSTIKKILFLEYLDYLEKTYDLGENYAELVMRRSFGEISKRLAKISFSPDPYFGWNTFLEWTRQPDKYRTVTVDHLGALNFETGAYLELYHLVGSGLLHDYDEQRRMSFAQIIFTHGANFKPYLIKALRSEENNTVLYYLLDSLGHINEQIAKSETFTETIPSIIPLLSHEDDDIREIAIKILGNWKIQEIVPTLIDVVSKDHSSDVVRTAINVLGEFKAEKAIPTLLNILRDQGYTHTLRIAVVNAISKIRTERAFLALLTALGSEENSHGVLEELVYGLEPFHDERSIPILAHVLREINPGRRFREIREIIIDSIGYIFEYYTSKLQETSRAAAEDVLLELAVSQLDYVIQEKAIKALSDFGSRKALTVIQDEILNQDRGDDVHLLAVETSKKIRHRLGLDTVDKSRLKTLKSAYKHLEKAGLSITIDNRHGFVEVFRHNKPIFYLSDSDFSKWMGDVPANANPEIWILVELEASGVLRDL